MKRGDWATRRITPKENSQLWHWVRSIINGKYITACGLSYGIAGAVSKGTIPGSACAKCLRIEEKADRKTMLDAIARAERPYR